MLLEPSLGAMHVKKNWQRNWQTTILDQVNTSYMNLSPWLVPREVSLPSLSSSSQTFNTRNVGTGDLPVGLFLFDQTLPMQHCILIQLSLTIVSSTPRGRYREEEWMNEMRKLFSPVGLFETERAGASCVPYTTVWWRWIRPYTELWLKSYPSSD